MITICVLLEYMKSNHAFANLFSVFCSCILASEVFYNFSTSFSFICLQRLVFKINCDCVVHIFDNAFDVIFVSNDREIVIATLVAIILCISLNATQVRILVLNATNFSLTLKVLACIISIFLC